MNSIELNKENLSILKECIESIKANGLTPDIVNYFYYTQIPTSADGELLSNFQVRTKGNIGSFMPRYNSIQMSFPYLKQVVCNNTNDLSELYKVSNKDDLYLYLSIFYLSHEIEHVYQYLIATGKITPPYKEVKNGYETIMSLLCKKESPIPNPISKAINLYHAISYKKDENIHVLERNANLGSSELVLSIANGNTTEDVINCFDSLRNAFISIGYHRDNKGCFNHTFRDIHMSRKCKSVIAPPSMSLEDRISYGFEVPEETRKLILERTK